MRLQITAEDRKRFEKFVDRSGGPDACHLWTGCRNRQGHGRFKIEGRTENAHRVAWVLAGNEITEERPLVLHNCPGGDMPACCNDRHLWTGTDADNLCDMARKGRGTKSKSGLPFGVQIRKGRFHARVQTNGRLLYLGSYKTAEEAAGVAMARKREIYG